MKAGAIHAKVNTEAQASAYSLGTQVQACRASAERHGYCVAAEHIFRKE